jgi:hypothetical protein
LYRRELSWDQKLAHISILRYRKLVEQMNPTEYHFLLNNKIAAKGLFGAFGIPMPKFFGRVSAKHGRTFDGRPLCTPADLEDLLRRIGADEICFKHVAGAQGRGFMRAMLELDSER